MPEDVPQRPAVLAALPTLGSGDDDMTLTRKRRKSRPRGTGCQLGRRCIAIGEYQSPTWEKPKRLCAKHMADTMMGDHVKAEEGCCRFCGTQGSEVNPLQWCHVLRRSYHAIRWDRDNSMVLCRTHHMMFTENPAKWEQWCLDVDIPWDELRVKALTGPPMQPLFVIERLKETA